MADEPRDPYPGPGSSGGAETGGGLVRRREAKAAIPIGFRPAPSDDELETNVLERWQGFGLVMTLFLAMFIPAYWLYFEPIRGTQAAVTQRIEAINRGHEIFKVPPKGATGFQAGCARCHGAFGGGGVVPNFVAPGTKNAPADYKCPDLRNVFQRQIVGGKKTVREAYTFVFDTIARGRVGTPMPNWGLGYGGPMNDQQIADVISYLISIQENIPKDVKLAAGTQSGPFSRLVAYGVESY